MKLTYTENKDQMDILIHKLTLFNLLIYFNQFKLTPWVNLTSQTATFSF